MSSIFSVVPFLSLEESTFQTKEKVFFDFKSSFHSQKNQILDFQTFKFYKIRNTFYWITKIVNNFVKYTTWKLVPGPVMFAKN